MLARNKIIQSLGGNAIETALGFIVVMFVTRTFSQSEVGIYFIVLAIVSILNNLKEGYLQNGFVKYLVESNFDEPVLRTGFFISIAGELVKIILFVCIAFVYPPIWKFVLFYGIYTISFSTYRLLIFIHKSRLEMNQIVKGNLILLISTICGLITLYAIQLNVEYIFLVMATSNLLVIVSLRSNRNLVRLNLFRRYDKKTLKQISFFGTFGLIKEVSGSIAHQAGVFISAYFLTLEAASILGLATRYSILISIPGVSLAGLLYPTILKNAHNKKKLVSVAVDGMGKMYALLVPIALLIILSAPFTISILHGNVYIDAAIVLAFKIIAAVFLIPIGSGFSSLMSAINKPNQITYLVIISSVSNMLLSIVFIYFFGLWGIAIAPLFSEAVGAYYMRRKLKEYLSFDVFVISRSVKSYWIIWTKKFIILPWKKLKYQ